MSVPKTCPQCGAVLPHDAPLGLCPTCLVRVATGWESEESGPALIEAGQEVPPPLTAAGAGALPMIFGGYELLEELGRGGMGVVYKARQIALNRIVALKMPLHGRFADAAFVDRFRLEAEAAAHLDHPNLVSIYEVGVHQGQPYYSMRLVEGQSLDREIADGRWNLKGGDRAAVQNRQRSAATLVARLAQAVRYAHERGILHRDIKPHNILVDTAGQPHLTDFGLAKLLNQESGLTLGTEIIGSPEFMAPEQAAGKTRQITTAVDVYGLGAILYVLLTGKAVFHAETPLQTVRLVIEQEPVRPRALNPAVDRDLETICLKCLQKEPAKRYATAQALADDLECWLRAEPIHARRVSGIERLWLWCRRQPVRASLAGALVLVFALGSGGVLWQWHRAKAGELFARQTAYATQMKQAQRDLADHKVEQAIRLLDSYRPTEKSGQDLRGWEWRYLWQFCREDEHSTLHRYPSAIESLAVSRDGKLLAAGYGTGVSLWDFATRRPRTELPDRAARLAFSPASNLLAIATQNAAGQSVVKMWDADSRKLTAILTNKACKAPIGHLAFSTDGKLLATSDIKGNIQVTEWSSNRILARRALGPLRRPQAGQVAFLPDGRRLALGRDAGVLLLLDWQTGELINLQTGKPDGVSALAISPTGDLLAAGFGYTDGTIGLWELNTGQPCGTLTNHTAWVEALVFTQDGQCLVSGGQDKTIRVWNITNQTELRCFQAYRHGVAALALLPDGETIISGGYDGAVCLWDRSGPIRSSAQTNLVISHGVVEKAEVPPSAYGPGPPDPQVVRRFGVAFAPDSRSFITSDPEGVLAVHDAHSMRVIDPLPELGSNNWGVALSPDGHWLAVGKASGTIQVWDWLSHRSVANRPIPFQWVGSIRFSRTGRFLLAYSTANESLSTDLRIWATRDWTEIPAGHVHYPGLLEADLSPDDRLLAVACLDGTLRLSRFPSGEPIPSFERSGGYFAVRFSPDGRLLALGRANGEVLLWDIVNRQEFATLSGHRLGTWGLAFSSDGHRLLTAGREANDAVKLWHLATRNELLVLPVLPADEQVFWDVGFSPDGNILFANSLGGVAHFWRAPSWAEIKEAEAQETRLDWEVSAPRVK